MSGSELFEGWLVPNCTSFVVLLVLPRRLNNGLVSSQTFSPSIIFYWSRGNLINPTPSYLVYLFLLLRLFLSELLVRPPRQRCVIPPVPPGPPRVWSMGLWSRRGPRLGRVSAEVGVKRGSWVVFEVGIMN